MWVVRYDDSVSFENGVVKPSYNYMFCHGSFQQKEGFQKNPRDSEIRVFYDPYVCHITCFNAVFFINDGNDCCTHNRTTGITKEFF